MPRKWRASGARREFNDEDWKGAVGIVSRYYNLVLADCGSGLFQPASRGVLSTVSGLVIVASAFLYEHSIVKPHDLSRLNRAFFSVNGFIGIALFVCALLDLLVRGLTV